ncbi:MAG: hypothetical protein BWX85_00116 [Chloroflexi bacterium ADurb.Bin120]|nr:MAG: hypothetical protein BWX85_00116 [Chloroflexi bacterium ADurb.Bin120]
MLRVNPQNGFFAINQTFIDHVHSDLDGCFRSTLARSSLQHPQLAFFDGELNILHIMIMILKVEGNLLKLTVDIGHFISQLADRFGVANTSHNILTLGIQKEITI